MAADADVAAEASGEAEGKSAALLAGVMERWEGLLIGTCFPRPG